MSLDANDLLLFAQVVEAGSFSLAAERSGIPKSTLSRRLSALETRLGERLLMRSTRRLVLTEFGSGVLEHARRLQEEADAALAYALHRQAVPKGRLRVSIPPDFAEWLLGPLFLQFAASYPEVKLELDLSPRRVDLLDEQFDLAIRVAAQLPDDATLVAQRLFQMEGGLYASPAYLRHYGVPEHPEDLMRHRALQLITSNGEPSPWLLKSGEASWQGLPDGPLAANSVSLLRLMATHGLGIAALSERFVAETVAQGLLVRVLPQWRLPSHTIWAVMPGRKLIPMKTRVFLDALRTLMVQ